MPLCEEVMLSFAAENEARMEAMIAARSNVVRKLDELVASFRRLRQEEITGEIIELSVGSVSAAASINCKRGRPARLFAARSGDADSVLTACHCAAIQVGTMPERGQIPGFYTGGP